MSVTPEFKQYLKQWIIYDNAIKKYNSHTKSLKDQKDTVEKELLFMIRQNNLQNIKINISDSKIIYNTTNTTPSLSYKFLEETLTEYLNDKEESVKICEFVKMKRETKKKINHSLKRITKI